jgi:hypothetical protein
MSALCYLFDLAAFCCSRPQQTDTSERYFNITRTSPLRRKLWGGLLVCLTIMVELLMSATSLLLHHPWAAFISRRSL